MQRFSLKLQQKTPLSRVQKNPLFQVAHATEFDF